MKSIGRGATALGILALTTACGDGSMQPGITTSGSSQNVVDTTPPETTEPVTSGEATAQAREMVTRALSGIADAATQVDDASSFEMVEEVLQADSCPPTLVASDPANPDNPTVTVLEEEDPFSVTETIDEAMRELNTFLLDKVFLDQFVENEDGTTVVYLLDPSVVCDADPECVTELTETPLRLRVRSAEERLYVEVLVGAEQNRAATLVIGDDIIAVEGDLSDVQRVLADLSANDPDAFVPETMEGVVAASLVRNAPGDYTMAWGVTQATHVRYDAGEQEPVDIRYGVSPEAMLLRINGPANQLSAALSYPTIDASAAGSLFCGETSSCGPQELDGTFSYHLAGLSGETTLSPGDSEIDIVNLGLGNEATTVSLNDATLGSLDVNADSGRRLSINAKSVEGGTLVTFSPELDLRLAMALSNLSEGLRMDLPEWLSDEIFDVTLTGESSASVLVPLRNCDGSATEQIRVESGTLSATATSATSSLSVQAGSCIGAVETPADGAHVVDTFEAQVCSF